MADARYPSRRRVERSVLLVVLLLLPTPALAQAEAAPSGSVPPEPAAAEQQAGGAKPVSDILNLDIEQLANVPVKVSSRTAPSSDVSGASATAGDATTAELLSQAPSVSYRRTSALNFDPSVRGYHSSQLNASANGMTQLKTRVDIDSLFSQIDPGIVQDASVIDGPYTSLYGPGFAILVAQLLPTPRFDKPETHLETTFVYGSNGQGIYSRDNILSGGKGWGMLFSYGLRASNDYTPGGGQPPVPSAYQTWDAMFALRYDLDPASRIEFNYLRTEVNDLQLPGIVYDIDNSKNDQFNVRYVIQEDRKGPEQLVLQSWWNQTYYHGDASRTAKQETFYYPFASMSAYSYDVVNTTGRGDLNSLGLRALRTLGERDAPQWTWGADWRRYQQEYQERDYNAAGDLPYYKVYGIPKSRMDDVGVLTDVFLPVSERFSVNVGGRVDYARAWLDVNSAAIAQPYPDWDPYYYCPGFDMPAYTLGMAYVSGKLQLTDAYTLKMGSGYAMRAPDLNELYVSAPFSPIARLGNSMADGLSDLSAERDLQFDLGLSYQTKKFSCGARGFFSFIWGYIEPVPEEVYGDFSSSVTPSRVLGRDFRYFPPYYRRDYPPFENDDRCQARYQYVNLDLATLFGGDLFAEAKLSDTFAVFGSMAYVCGTNQSPMAFYATSWKAQEGYLIRYGGTDGLPGIYPLCGTLGCRWTAPDDDRWMVEFSSQLVAPQNHVAVVLSELPSPGFVVFNLRGYYRVRKNVRVTLDLRNLLNTDYAEPGSLFYKDLSGNIAPVKEPGFAAVLGVDARF